MHFFYMRCRKEAGKQASERASEQASKGAREQGSKGASKVCGNRGSIQLSIHLHTWHVLIQQSMNITNPNACCQASEMRNVFRIRTMNRVVQGGCAVGPKVGKNVIVLLCQP